MFVNQCQHVPAASAQERRWYMCVSFPVCPFLAEGQSGFVGSRYGSTWVVAGERKAERRENQRIGREAVEHPACAENSRETHKSRKKKRSIPTYTSCSCAEVNAPRAHTDVRRVSTAHDPPSRRATLVFSNYFNYEKQAARRSALVFRCSSRGITVQRNIDRI